MKNDWFLNNKKVLFPSRSTLFPSVLHSHSILLLRRHLQLFNCELKSTVALRLHGQMFERVHGGAELIEDRQTCLGATVHLRLAGIRVAVAAIGIDSTA